MEKSKTFCVNPYLNLSVHPQGTIKPCCMSAITYKTENGSQTLNQASILEFWNSKTRQDTIDQLNAGEQIPGCVSCWKEENAGKQSKRIRDNKIHADTELSKDMLPVVVDLAIGNLCNIKCRICSPSHSSPWMLEEAKIHFPNDIKKYTNQEKWISYKESFAYDNKFFWNDIVKLLPNVIKFDFAGGEPLYIEKHWDIVKLCVESGWSKNQHIHYNTNGTIYPEKYMHLLEQFKVIDIQVSSDGVGKKFEYLRHPAKWEAVESNIDKFITARNENKTEWLLSVCVSISAFNVYDFFETFEHYASKGLSMYINLVHDHHGIRILPPELKKIIISKLMSSESKYQPSQWMHERDMVCKHLENTSYNDNDWKEFWKEIQIRDAIRNESFSETFPEYYQEIKQFIIWD
jgi:MoaA/NifB/PqqE/SkfB family radical SAM enzyme